MRKLTPSTRAYSMSLIDSVRGTDAASAAKAVIIVKRTGRQTAQRRANILII